VEKEMIFFGSSIVEKTLAALLLTL